MPGPSRTVCPSKKSHIMEVPTLSAQMSTPTMTRMDLWAPCAPESLFHPGWPPSSAHNLHREAHNPHGRQPASGCRATAPALAPGPLLSGHRCYLSCPWACPSLGGQGPCAAGGSSPPDLPQRHPLLTAAPGGPSTALTQAGPRPLPSHSPMWDEAATLPVCILPKAPLPQKACSCKTSVSRSA